jgi:hypothetical protein
MGLDQEAWCGNARICWRKLTNLEYFFATRMYSIIHSAEDMEDIEEKGIIDLDVLEELEEMINNNKINLEIYGVDYSQQTLDFITDAKRYISFGITCYYESDYVGAGGLERWEETKIARMMLTQRGYRKKIKLPHPQEYNFDYLKENWIARQDS